MVPRLVGGERLGRAEFECRYEATPDLKKAELLAGVVHVGGRVMGAEGRLRASVITCLGIFRSATPGVDCLANASVRLGDEDETQPDVVLRRRRGTSVIDEDELLAGAPELVVDIALSTWSADLDARRRVYERHRCPEYLVFAPVQGQLHAFVRDGGSSCAREADPDGIYRSLVMPGLWLDVGALVGSDGPRALQVVRLGLASPEHTACWRRTP